MGPKRRKLSLDQADIVPKDAKRTKVDSDVNTDSCSAKEESDGENEDSQVDDEEDPQRDEGKDDPLRQVRISKRLISKRGHQGGKFDKEEWQTEKKIKQVVYTPSKKAKTKFRNKLPAESRPKLSDILPNPANKASKKKKKKGDDKKRRFVKWTHNEKKRFYDAIMEVGRNFEAISLKMGCFKEKECVKKDSLLVRYFYYRTWRTISEKINVDFGGVTPRVKELYTLVHYGYLRKYVKEQEPIFWSTLNQLISEGRALVGKNPGLGRMGNKILRTPLCKSLRIINKLSEDKKEKIAPIPYNVVLELTPKNYEAWSKVQALSQNPRLRFKMTATKTLASMFEHLDRKWKSSRLKIKEHLIGKAAADHTLVCTLHPKVKLEPVVIMSDPRDTVRGRYDVTFKHYRDHVFRNQVLDQYKNHTKRRKNHYKIKQEFLNSQKIKDEAATVEGGPEGGRDATDSSTEGQGTCSTSTMNDAETGTDVPSEVCLPDAASATPHILDLPHFHDLPHIPLPFASLLAAAASDMDKIQSNNYEGSDKNHTKDIKESAQREKPAGSKPPGAAMLNDENARFPDSSPFSPPNLEINDNASSSMDSPQKNTSSPSKTQCSNTESLDDDMVCLGGSDNSVSPIKPDLPLLKPDYAMFDEFPSKEDIRLMSEKEMLRLADLARTGFTMTNSTAVTLLHLSLLLGKCKVIKFEYEWVQMKKGKPPDHHVMDTAVNQISNLLRRLSHVAALEFSEVGKKLENADLCGKAAGSESLAAGRGPAPCLLVKDPPSEEFKEEFKPQLKDACTNTEPLKVQVIQKPLPLIPSHPAPSPVLLPRGAVITGARQFMAGPRNPLPRAQFGPRIHALGPHTSQDPVFRVPFAKPVQLDINKKLLGRRRSLTPKSRKAPPIIVQRTLLPKPNVPQNQMMTYLQPGTQSVQGQVMVGVNADGSVNLDQQHVIQIDQTQISTQMLNSSQADNLVIYQQSMDQNQSHNPLDVHTTSADINVQHTPQHTTHHTTHSATHPAEDSPHVTHPLMPENTFPSTTNPLGLHTNTPMSTSVFSTFTPMTSSVFSTSTSAMMTSTSPLHYQARPTANTSSVRQSGMSDLSLLAQSDISISDFDLSMSGVSVSNMSMGAGDKFLDMVLNNTEQGFTGLIDQAEKSQAFTSLASHSAAAATPQRLDRSVLNTPEHIGISTVDVTPRKSSSIMFSSPLKLNLSNQSWLNTTTPDVSLSALLDDSSMDMKTVHVKDGSVDLTNISAFFDSASSDAMDGNHTGSHRYTQVGLQGLNEGSLDLVSKFESLAQQFMSTDQGTGSHSTDPVYVGARDPMTPSVASSTTTNFESQTANFHEVTQDKTRVHDKDRDNSVNLTPIASFVSLAPVTPTSPGMTAVSELSSAFSQVSGFSINVTRQGKYIKPELDLFEDVKPEAEVITEEAIAKCPPETITSIDDVKDILEPENTQQVLDHHSGTAVLDTQQEKTTKPEHSEKAGGLGCQYTEVSLLDTDASDACASVTSEGLGHSQVMMDGSDVVVFNIESLDSDNMVLNIVQQDHPSRDNSKLPPDAPLATFNLPSIEPGDDSTEVHVPLGKDKGVGADSGIDDSTGAGKSEENVFNTLTFVQEEEKSAVLSIMDL